jgi:ParB family chromosome partitioning protein
LSNQQPTPIDEVELGRSRARDEVLLDIKSLKVFDYSPREHRIIEEHVNELMEDLNENSQLTPIIVNKSNNGIVEGHHRVEAARRLGWTKIRAIYRTLSEEQCHYFALKFNVLTKTLTAIEEANKMKILIQKFGCTHAKIAKMFRGKTEAWVSQRLALAGLSPKVQDAIEDGKITPTHGIYIAEAPTPKLQESLANYVEEHQLTTIETKEDVQKLKAKNWRFADLEKELSSFQPTDEDLSIVKSVRDYSTRESIAPSAVKTSIVDISSLNLFRISPPIIKMRFADHLCRTCASKVNACPICKGKKEVKNVEIHLMAKKSDAIDAYQADGRFFQKISGKK